MASQSALYNERKTSWAPWSWRGGDSGQVWISHVAISDVLALCDSLCISGIWGGLSVSVGLNLVPIRNCFVWFSNVWAHGHKLQIATGTIPFHKKYLDCKLYFKWLANIWWTNESKPRIPLLGRNPFWINVQLLNCIRRDTVNQTSVEPNL